MDAAWLETYLHEHIPLSAAMQARVTTLEPAGVTLEAPLAPNINHRETVFGGSIASLATLAAWSLVHTRLRSEGLESRVVVMSSQIDYHAPATGAFLARCDAPNDSDWALFTRTLSRRGRARLTLTSTVSSEGVLAATLTGTFVAITPG
ncbi:MAG: YiiD C-terminal domain-containing protein [Armatimonas sp.]